ncbi:Separase [Aphelenchoides bicaudatus]|nr:Separase [Aphelenchoides bicaudatus]
MPTVDDFKAFNKAVSDLQGKWQIAQSEFHQFITSDSNAKLIIANGFDAGKPKLHLPALKYISTLMADFDREAVQKTIDLWPGAVEHVIKQKRITKERVALFGSAHILISILLAGGDLYKALQLMIELLKNDETSPKISLAALALAIELEEVDIYEEVRKIVPLEPMPKVFTSWLEALDLNARVRLCGSSDEMKNICTEVYSKLAKLSQEKSKTYSMCYNEIALRNALVYAAKQSDAKIQLIGDPLYHLNRCYDVAYTGMHGFFSDCVVSNGKINMFDDGQSPSMLFDKAFLFHQYCETSGRFINELIDCGMMVDAEQRFVPIFKYTLFSCFPYRLLSAVNIFYLIRRLITFKSEDVLFVGEWVQELCSVTHDWMLKQEQVYSKALLNNFTYNEYNALLKLKNSEPFDQFGRQEVASLFVSKKVNRTENDFPISFAANLMRATVQFILQADKNRIPLTKKQLVDHVLKKCKRAETLCRAQWLMLKQLSRTSLPVLKLSWIQSDANEENLPFENEIKQCVNESYQEYKHFQHLYYVQWRRNCATYIAPGIEPALKRARPDHIAMFLSESMAIPLRSSMRVRRTEQLYPKRIEHELNKGDSIESLVTAVKTLNLKDESANSMFTNFPLGFFESSESFRQFIGDFPLDITAFQFAFDSNQTLWLTRYHCEHEPYSIPLFATVESCNQKKKSFDLLFERLRKILAESEATTTGKDMIAKEFWAKRRSLDTKMENLVVDMQTTLLGKLAPLCRPFGPQAIKSLRANKIQKRFEKLGFRQNASMIITHLLDSATEEEWIEVVKMMAERENLVKTEPIDINALNQQKFSSLTKEMGSKKDRCAGNAYIFLILPPSLSSVSWECMSVFKNTLITRIPSLFTLKTLLIKHETIPKQVNARNSYYVLNPAGNLSATQKRLEEFVSKMEWRGVMGKAPSKEDLTEALKSQEMYVFLGHGSGRRYIGNNLKRLDCRSVCLLMGCSSVEIIQEGRDYDGRSSVYDFILADCPCVVGCLWMVTDGEADRFFMELMNFCSETENDALVESRDNCRFMMRGIARARLACKLPYLTGGAVVSYGLPSILDVRIKNVMETEQKKTELLSKRKN